MFANINIHVLSVNEELPVSQVHLKQSIIHSD